MTVVSVIVTTRNSARTLSRCLASVRAQDSPSIELLVVDNHSTDETPAIAAQYADKVVTAGPERCTQRNIGAREASGEYLLIVDSDMYLREDVVSVCLSAIRSGAAGVIVPEKSIGKGFWAECKAYERDFYVRDVVVSAARFFRRDVYLGLGGFDENLVSGEDWDLAIRLGSCGETRFADSMIYHDEGRLSLWGSMKKKFYYGRHVHRFIRKHGPAAMKRLSPLRTSYFSAATPFFRDPRHAAGTVLMRACEISAGVAGLIYSRFVRA